MRNWKIARRVVLLLIGVALGLTVTAQPVWASHSIDYNIVNNDTFETRATSFGTTDTAFRIDDYPGPLQEFCWARHTTKSSDSVQKRYHFYLVGHNGAIYDDSPVYYMNYGESATWSPGSATYLLSTVHFKIQVVVSTNGGGYIDTINMQPETQLPGKQHFEYPYRYFNWPGGCGN